MHAIPVRKRTMLQERGCCLKKTKQKRLEHCGYATPLMRIEANIVGEQKPCAYLTPGNGVDWIPQTWYYIQGFPWRLKCPQQVGGKHATKDSSTKPKEWLQGRGSSFKTRGKPHSHSLLGWHGAEDRWLNLALLLGSTELSISLVQSPQAQSSVVTPFIIKETLGMPGVLLW